MIHPHTKESVTHDPRFKASRPMKRMQVVRHEAAQEMRVWSLGFGLQEQASKHLKLLWSRVMVVSDEEKVSQDEIS